MVPRPHRSASRVALSLRLSSVVVIRKKYCVVMVAHYTSKRLKDEIVLQRFVRVLFVDCMGGPELFKGLFGVED